MPSPSAQQRDQARREVAGFLASRRAAVSPESVGLPAGGGRRRVAGLRREEVALLAGISVDYYARLERGLVGAVSDQVLHALAQVLRLDAVEAEHLRALVRAASGVAPEPVVDSAVRPELVALLDLMPRAAAFVRNARLDILAHNRLFGQLYDQALDAGEPPNILRFLFLDDRSHIFYRHWDRLARGAVGSVRAEAARSPGDEVLAQLVQELQASSPDFGELWRGHPVELYQSGTQQFRHHLVGNLELRYETFAVVADPDLTMIAYHAAPGTSSDAALRRLVGESGH